MKKILFAITLSGIALLLPATAEAQVVKQVEVTKAYIPEVADAVKLPIEPNMVDTVKMRPEIDYSISPKIFATDLATHRFKPATVTYWEFNRPKTFYAKIGAGYQLNSVGDVYASIHNARVGYLLAYVNHHGEYEKRYDFARKMASKLGVSRSKNDAIQMQNRVGVAGGVYCGRQIFEGDINYNSEMYNRYVSKDGGAIDFEDVNLKLRFGDSFTDLSRTNFNIALYGSYFNDKSGWSARPKYSLQEVHVGAEAKVARKFKVHYVELGAGYDGRWGIKPSGEVAKDLSRYIDNTARVGLRYGFTHTLFDLMVGADYCYDKVKARAEVKGRASHYVLPMAKLRMNVGQRNVVTPFVELESSLENNSYHSLVLRNPYVELVENQFSMPNTVNYDLRFGIEGRLAKDKLAYRLYAGMSFIENSVYWYSYDYMWLRPETARRNVMSLNLEVDYRPISRLEISAGVHGYLFTDFAKIKVESLGESRPLEGGRSPIDGYFKARYDFGKISVGASADFYGKAEWSSFERIDKTLAPEPANMEIKKLETPFYANVSLDVDWEVSKHCSLFLEGRNLANMDIYRWAWYRDLGIHFTVGARVNF